MFRSKEKRQQPPRKGRQNMLNFVSTYLLTVCLTVLYYKTCNSNYCRSCCGGL